MLHEASCAQVLTMVGHVGLALDMAKNIRTTRRNGGLHEVTYHCRSYLIYSIVYGVLYIYATCNLIYYLGFSLTIREQCDGRIL